MKSIEYRGFISFSHKDSGFSMDLHRRLEHFRVPAKLRGSNLGLQKLGVFFRDREELAANVQLTEQIRDALARSRCLIVICSLNSVRSAWVQKEVETYLSVRPNGEIFAVIARGEPPDCIPGPLRALDVIAADFRPHADGVEDGTLKLISGIMGIGFSQLKDRVAEDIRKRQRSIRLIALSFAMLAVLAIGGLVATLLFFNRANNLAEAAIATSGEISDKAYEMGLNSAASLESVETLLDFSSEKLKLLEEYNLQRDELKSRSAWVRLRFAHLYLQRGEFEKALSVAEEVAIAMDGRKQYGAMLVYTVALTSKTQALQQLHRYPEALAASKLALEANKRFVDAYEDRYETRLALAEGERMHGEVLSDNGRKEQALDHITSSVQLFNQLMKEFPNSATFSMRLAEDYEIMGDIAQAMGDANRSSSWYGESATWRNRYLQYNKPSVVACQQMLEIALKGAEAHLQQANYKQAANLMKIAADAMKTAYKHNPELTGAKDNMQHAERMLAKIEAGQNPFTTDPADLGKIGALLSRAQQHFETGDQLAEEGDMERALRAFAEAAKLLRPLVANGSGGTEGRELLGMSTNLGGACAVDAGDFTNAEVLFKESIEIWQRLARDFPDVPQYATMKTTAERTLEGLK